MPGIGRIHRLDVPFRALSALFELNHVIPDAECTEAADKAGKPAEAVLLHIKGGESFFEVLMDNAQIIHMALAVTYEPYDLLFDLIL